MITGTGEQHPLSITFYSHQHRSIYFFAGLGRDFSFTYDYSAVPAEIVSGKDIVTRSRATKLPVELFVPQIWWIYCRIDFSENVCKKTTGANR